MTSPTPSPGSQETTKNHTPLHGNADEHVPVILQVTLGRPITNSNRMCVDGGTPSNANCMVHNVSRREPNLHVDSERIDVLTKSTWTGSDADKRSVVAVPRNEKKTPDEHNRKGSRNISPKHRLDTLGLQGHSECGDGASSQRPTRSAMKRSGQILARS